jgi:hypothetical protein
MKHKTFKEITREQLKKVYNYERWITIMPFVYTYEIDEVRKKLALSGIRYRTEPVVKNEILIGYKVKVLE